MKNIVILLFIVAILFIAYSETEQFHGGRRHRHRRGRRRS